MGRHEFERKKGGIYGRVQREEREVENDNYSIISRKIIKKIWLCVTQCVMAEAKFYSRLYSYEDFCSSEQRMSTIGLAT